MKSVRTSVVLSEEILEEADAMVRRGEAASRDELFETAVRNELRARRNAAYAAGMVAAYESLEPDERQELLELADGNLDETLAAIKQVESGE